jgi:AbrB-like transcriptional regulator
MTALVGVELLDKIASLSDVTKDELAEACGYFTEKKDGTKSYHYTALNEAIIEAKGVALPIKRASKAEGGPGRELSYRTSQQARNNIVVGAGYVTQLGFEPGQQFEIVVDKEAGSITLFAVDESESACAVA